MSTILFTNITVADPKSPHNGTKTNIFISDGKITSIGKEIPDADQVIDSNGDFISPGWTDVLAFCAEPGEEWKETLNSLANAGSAGGFTRIAAFCGSHPLPDNASAVSAILEKGSKTSAEILPIGCFTTGAEGKEMAEIFDMKTAGAVAFFDGDHSVSQNGIKSRILEYAGNCNAPVYMFPFDKSLAPGGSMHEGLESTKLGLKGIPSLSEINALQADIAMAGWLKIPLYVVRVSCKESVELIRSAKNSGQKIFAAVPAMNLVFTDSNLEGFDENYKVLPPLRTSADRDALISGLIDGTIDAVCSNHVPQDAESKDVEFDYSAWGASTIQSVFSCLVTALKGKADADLIANILAYRSAAMLNRDVVSVETGNTGNFTIFSPENKTEFSAMSNKSKSKNNPFFGSEMSGRVSGTIYNGKYQPAEGLKGSGSKV